MLDNVAAASLTHGIGHVVVSVADVAAARGFYESVGLNEARGERWPAGGNSIVFRLENGQALVLAEGPVASDRELSAAHVALAMTPAAREKVRATGLQVFDYREDRPAEADENFYLVDPSGNRIQIVARDDSGPAGRIDHVAIEVSDIMWAEAFYGDGMGWPILHRVGWSTNDYLRAKAKGEAGIKDAMPGSRYINERYSQFEKERRAVRPNPQLYFDTGAGCTVAVYLASRHYTAPPDRQRVGVPCLGLRAAVALDRVASVLEKFRMPLEVAPAGKSLFFRDLGGNFVEFTSGA